MLTRQLNKTLSGIIVLVASLACQSQTRFPGSRSQATSPAGRYAVINVEADHPPYHCLKLRNRESREETPLHCYSRHVQVFWSPGGERLVVNDFYASNQSRSLLFTPGDKILVDLRVALFEALPPHEKNSFASDHHTYIEAMRWKDHSTVLVKIWGYGDNHQKGFSRIYEYSVDGSVKRVK